GEGYLTFNPTATTFDPNVYKYFRTRLSINRDSLATAVLQVFPTPVVAGNFLSASVASSTMKETQFDLSALAVGGTGFRLDPFNYNNDATEDSVVFDYMIVDPCITRGMEFGRDGDLNGAAGNHLSASSVTGGVFLGTSDGADPQMNITSMGIDADTYKYAEIRMKAGSGLAGMFWNTVAQGAATWIPFGATDGAYHTYLVDLSEETNWTGSATFLRLDPTNQDGVDFEVDYVRFMESLVTIEPVVPDPYAFFDTFDTPDTTDVNANYTTRQTNGFISSTYTEFADASNLIESNRLSIIGGGALDLDVNLADHMVGHDFTVSIDATMLNTNAKWSAFYVLSANENSRGLSRMGFHYWGAPQATAFTVYSGVAAQVATGVTVAQLNTLFGSYDREVPHTIQFVSTEGPTNTYDFVIDGLVVLNDLPYAFSEDTTRTLGFVATVTPATKGVLYDNLGLSYPGAVTPDATYEQWAIDNSLVGDYALRTADPDTDGMDNLLEYALGGDPNVDDADAKLPVSGIENVGGTNWFGYVYRRRVDAVERGLEYGVTLNDTGLVYGSWTNIGTSAEYATASIDEDFEEVTNVFSTVEVKKFVGLEVKEN
ncbi:MAG: hypothetical protein DRQ24_12560, partial [Candidatus Latescibacterota bacterium]